MREVRETVTKIDKGKLVERCEGKAGLITEVEKPNCVALARPVQVTQFVTMDSYPSTLNPMHQAHTVTQNAELINHEIQHGKGLAHYYTCPAAAPRIIIEFKSTRQDS